jgi:hypothetical protein
MMVLIAGPGASGFTMESALRVPAQPLRILAVSEAKRRFCSHAIDWTIDLGQRDLAGSLGRDDDFGFETLVEDASRIEPE